MRKLLLLIVVFTVGVSTVAVAAPSQKTSGTVYAGVTHAEGDDLYVSGDFKDKILGRGAIVYVTTVDASTEPGSFLVEARKITIYTRKGTLTGSGEAIQTYNPDGTTSVADGTFSLTKGTGAYKGHELKGKFEGPQVDGVYQFSYTGRYK